jgi:hypothetical protein
VVRPRRLHFLGTLPPSIPPDPYERMAWILDRTQGHELTTMACDVHPSWAVRYLRRIGERPQFKITKNGDYTTYKDMRSHRVAKGVTLRPEHVSMNQLGEQKEILDAFRTIRSEREELAGTKLQVGIPNPLDIALYMFPSSPWDALRYLPVFEQAALDEAHLIAEMAGDDVVWQLESPSFLIGMNMVRYAPPLQPLVGDLLVRQAARMIRRLPDPDRLFLHLCYGNHEEKEWFAPRSLRTPVWFLNRLKERLDVLGIRLPPAHLPVAYGTHAAPASTAFYAPLKNLRREWRVIPGVASAVDAESGVRALQVVERTAGREAYAVGTACGLGRTTEEAAERAVADMRRIAEAPRGSA